MIDHSIRQPGIAQNPLRLGFSVWARNAPKNYLGAYPKAALQAGQIEQSSSVQVCAIVDDVWPRIIHSRSPEEQLAISKLFRTSLPGLGFDEVHLVSEFAQEQVLGVSLELATKVTLSEFWKLLPQTKKDAPNELTLAEVAGFLWHMHVLDIAIERFALSGFLAGIRSEFFYLAARRILSPHNVYFVNTS